MARQYILGGFPSPVFINETYNQQRITSSGVFLDETGGTIAAAVGSSAGTGAASGVGASIAASVGSSIGAASVAGVGASISASVGSSSGAGSVSGVGAAAFAAIGSASGSSTVAGIGAATAGAIGFAAGTSGVSGVGDFSTEGASPRGGLAVAWWETLLRDRLAARERAARVPRTGEGRGRMEPPPAGYGQAEHLAAARGGRFVFRGIGGRGTGDHGVAGDATASISLVAAGKGVRGTDGHTAGSLSPLGSGAGSARVTAKGISQVVVAVAGRGDHLIGGRALGGERLSCRASARGDTGLAGQVIGSMPRPGGRVRAYHDPDDEETLTLILLAA